MLTQQQNDRIMRVGPGTPMGVLMRRYWHPIAASGELDERPTRQIRLLGEDLVLYRDKSGTLGLIDRLCAHRRVDLSYGIPEEHGLRCMYHGWVYDETGQCVEQPFEETVHPDGRFKEKVKLAGYPIQELGGLIFAYLGPLPAPLLPNWDILAQRKNVWREMFIAELPVNWLQCMENSVDPVHLEWLHGVYGAHTARLDGRRDVVAEGVATYGRHKKISFDANPRGITKRRVYGSGTESDAKWTVGHPLLFPNILQQGGGGRFFLQYRVPIDDEHTWHVELTSYWFPDDVDAAEQDRVPHTYVPLKRPDGLWRSDDTFSQDHIAWILQGAMMDRTSERLGESDKGLIFYRQMLVEQMDVVEAGGEPIGVIRDPAENVMLHNEQEGWSQLGHNADIQEIARYGSPLRDEIAEVLTHTKNTSGLTA
jgi:5,5'-dehydrodivanillate O-demethylase